MRSRLTTFLVCLIAIASLVSVGLAATTMPVAPQMGRSQNNVWNGVYTENQAMRGSAEFEANCAGCHQTDVDPENTDAQFVGRTFMSRWREYDLDSLFTFISASMPRRDPGSLPDQAYVDIIAHFLDINAFPAGAEALTRANLDGVQIEGKDGFEPLPSGALVQLVGCLNQDAEDNWVLLRASEPLRTDTANGSTAEELGIAEKTPPGYQRFLLQSLGFLGADFDPEAYRGSKMQTKGYLIRQPNRARIDLVSMEMVAATCE